MPRINHKPVEGEFGQRSDRRRHRHSIAHPDVGDAGGVDEAIGIVDDIGAANEGLTSPGPGATRRLCSPFARLSERGTFRCRHGVDQAKCTQLTNLDSISPRAMAHNTSLWAIFWPARYNLLLLLTAEMSSRSRCMLSAIPAQFASIANCREFRYREA
jgi:hypothetical protein